VCNNEGVNKIVICSSGNGRLRHAGVFTDWSASSFMDELALNRYFTLKDGTLTVKLGGLYYFYSQVNTHANNTKLKLLIITLIEFF
jgi:hypothetical protein